MRVEYSYLPEQFANPDPIFEGLRALVASGDFTLGAAVGEFERRFADALGAKHGVGVGSGTDAIFLSLKAAGVGPGDEVITMTSTFVATVGAIVATGAKPVFVDVTEEYTMDPALIGAAITERTKALVPVHWAGTPADLPEIMDIAQERDLVVIEDSCQAIGGAVDGKVAGTWGLTGCFSLHPLKNLNVWGDGGIIITDSDGVADKLRLLRNHGLADRDTVALWGYNSRLDSLHAVVGNHLIEQFQEITERRIANAARLDAGLADVKQITLPPRRANKRYVYHLYVVQAEERDALLKHLLSKEIEAKIHYPRPLHLQPAAKEYGLGEGAFPVAERQAEAIITFPAHQHLREEQIEFMVAEIRSFYGA